MSREESKDTGYVRRDVSSRAGYVVIANKGFFFCCFLLALNKVDFVINLLC